MSKFKLSILVFIVVISGCSDSKDSDQIQSTNQWDQSEANWDNSTWE